jgi:hypothetical protein
LDLGSLKGNVSITIRCCALQDHAADETLGVAKFFRYTYTFTFS